MFQTLMNNPLALGGIGAAIVLLLGLLLWRRRQNASLENSLVGATTTDSSSVFGTTGGRSVDTGSHSMQTDFSQSAIGSIDTDEVDPVAEADVYMAYGRDAQAEEILKEALQKDPTRQAVRLKLLEIYAARKDLGSFETTAGEIYAVTGGSGTDWDKAAALGRTVDPTNPMYGAGTVEPTAPGAMAASAAVAAAESAAAVAEYTGPQTDSVQPADVVEDEHPILDLDLGLKDTEQTAAPDFALDANTVKPEDIALDLDLGEAPAAESAETPASEEPEDFSPSGTFIMDAATKKAVEEMGEAPETAGLDIDFRLPDAAPETETKDAAAAAPAAPGGDAHSIDLDFKVDEPRAVPAVDLSKINLDLGSDEAGGDAQWQEVATKLDLAKAYEEMGDKDGARELLNEVLKEGDSAQQDQARNLLQTMQ
jgi:pilus assembly protein FimV